MWQGAQSDKERRSRERFTAKLPSILVVFFFSPGEEPKKDGGVDRSRVNDPQPEGVPRINGLFRPPPTIQRTKSIHACIHALCSLGLLCGM